jgi:hypothetical protein
MPTTPATLLPGLPYPVANVLAAEIDAGASASANNLGRVFPGPVAIELARQAVAGTGDVPKLVACGINPTLATAIKAAIDA